ncbi:hypothetical protein ACJX0J_006237, partial [Zea mays]
MYKLYNIKENLFLKQINNKYIFEGAWSIHEDVQAVICVLPIKLIGPSHITFVLGLEIYSHESLINATGSLYYIIMLTDHGVCFMHKKSQSKQVAKQMQIQNNANI